MRQHSESCTIDQQQEVHFLCLEKKKITIKESAGSSSGTHFTEGRCFCRGSFSGLLFPRSVRARCALLAGWHSVTLEAVLAPLVWNTKFARKSSGVWVQRFPKGTGCWVLQHTPVPKAFPCSDKEVISFGGADLKPHWVYFVIRGTGKKKMTNTRYLIMGFFFPDQVHYTSLVFYLTSECQFPSWKQFIFIKIPQDNPVMQKQNSWSRSKILWLSYVILLLHFVVFSIFFHLFIYTTKSKVIFL